MSTAIRPTDDEWMSVAEFAAIIGKSPGTVKNDIRRGGDLPAYYKITTKKFRFRRSDVDAWLLKFRRAITVDWVLTTVSTATALVTLPTEFVMTTV